MHLPALRRNCFSSHTFPPSFQQKFCMWQVNMRFNAASHGIDMLGEFQSQAHPNCVRKLCHKCEISTIMSEKHRQTGHVLKYLSQKGINFKFSTADTSCLKGQTSKGWYLPTVIYYLARRPLRHTCDPILGWSSLEITAE